MGNLVKIGLIAGLISFSMGVASGIAPAFNPLRNDPNVKHYLETKRIENFIDNEELKIHDSRLGLKEISLGSYPDSVSGVLDGVFNMEEYEKARNILDNYQNSYGDDITEKIDAYNKFNEFHNKLGKNLSYLSLGLIFGVPGILGWKKRIKSDH